MTRREIAQLAFTEAYTGDDVFMSVSVVSEFVEVLLTTRHHGDIEVYPSSSECKKIVEALERAALAVEGAKSSMEREITSIRSVREGTKMELVVSIRVERGLVVFDLAFEGDEDEDDRVWVYLTSDQCRWLIGALENAELVC